VALPHLNPGEVCITGRTAERLLVWLVTSLKALKRNKAQAQDDSLDSVFPVLVHALRWLIMKTLNKQKVHVDMPVDYKSFGQGRSKRAKANPLQDCKVDSSEAVTPAKRKAT
jgi:hypothetical protein